MDLSDTTVYRGGSTAPTLFIATTKATLEVKNGKLEFSTWVSVSKGYSTIQSVIGPKDFPTLLQAIATASRQ